MKDKRQFIIWDRRDGEQPQPTYWKDRGGFRHEIQPKAQGKPRQDEDGLFISDGILGKISRHNVYLTAYPDMDNARWPDGCDSLDDLQIGQRVENVVYNLSGSKGVYDIYRIQDKPPDTPQEYVQKKGVGCPVCGSHDLNTSTPDVQDHGVVVSVECDSCGATWSDVYNLAGYVGLQQ